MSGWTITLTQAMRFLRRTSEFTRARRPGLILPDLNPPRAYGRVRGE